MSINKHKVLQEWVKQFTKSWLYLENIDMYPNMRAIVPNYGEFIVRQDILGNKYKRYTFAFVGVERFSSLTDYQNANNMEVFDKFNDWILEQDRLGNHPDFGDGTSEYKLTPLQNMANVAMINEERTMAKYMLAIQIDYLEREE